MTVRHAVRLADAADRRTGPTVMSGYAFRATRVCADCRCEFIAFIVIAATGSVVWWRREQTRCEDCREGDK